MSLRVISGGQTGVDRAALDVALELGLPTGGFCPRERRAEDGRVPARYALVETPSRDYRQRTAWNVRAADGTLLLARGAPSGGTALTLRLARRAGKPFLLLDLADAPDPRAVRRFLREHRVRTLNVAGPRESHARGIGAEAAAFLRKALAPAAPRAPRPAASEAPSRELTRRLAAVADRLAERYGRPRLRRGDPLDELILTILSQNTSDVNSGRAFRSLKAAFPTWAAAARATPDELEDAIRCGGLARTKSRSILGALRAVREREGRFDLRVLRRLAPAEAEARLRGLPGVGPKTRACVLLFACGHPAFPVDTHVHRIARRLGVVPSKATAERAHARLAPAVPRGRHLDLHLNLIRLGRAVCRPAAPDCPACPLRPLCAHARAER